MAMEKFKLAFLALAFVCLMQNVVAAPSPLAGGEKFSAPSNFEIICHALAEICKSFSELVQSLMSIVGHRVAEGMIKLGGSIYIKAHVIITSSGVEDSSLTFTEDQFLEYRVVTNTLLQLRQKLDLMERFEEVYESIVAETTTSFTSSIANHPRESPRQILSTLLWSFSQAADRRLKENPELKDVYLKIREQVKEQVLKVKPIRVDLSQVKSNSAQLSESFPEEVKIKMLNLLINKQFLHHTLNRISILKKEYFLVARSTLELAKKPNKLEMVQKLYDETLDKVSKWLDFSKADAYDMSKGLFKELKSAFDANPTLNQEWREIQKYVSKRHEWDRGIWDLDLIPI